MGSNNGGKVAISTYKLKLSIANLRGVSRLRFSSAIQLYKLI